VSQTTTSTVDVRVESFNFTSTEVALEAISEAGRDLFASVFGAGARSITLPKSELIKFAAFATSKNVLVG
jgi:hypothetical protein